MMAFQATTSRHLAHHVHEADLVEEDAEEHSGDGAEQISSASLPQAVTRPRSEIDPPTTRFTQSRQK